MKREGREENKRMSEGRKAEESRRGSQALCGVTGCYLDTRVLKNNGI